MEKADNTCNTCGLLRRLVLFMLVLVMLVFTWKATAATYSASTVAATGFDTTTTPVVWEQINTGYPIDDDKQTVNIGFTFYFGSIAYTQLRIHTNGSLDFGADQNFHQVYTNTALATGSGDRLIMAYWDDLNGSTGGSVTYDTLGSAPDRRFVVTWQNLPHYPNNGSYTIQAVLYEATGEIRFRYGAGDANGSSATIGVEVDNSDFTQYSYNSNSVSPANDILFSPTFPAISSVTASCTNYNEVIVNFQSPVHPAFAANAAYYAIDNGISVTSASVTAASTVTLQTSTLATGTTYTLQTLQPLLQSASFDVLSTLTATYRDEFNAVSYSNNDGTLNWSTNWIEVNESDGPNNGDERVVSNQGSNRLRIQDNNFGGEGAMREADLSSFTSATLSYLYRRDRLDTASDYVTVSISTDGGATWVPAPLATYAGPTNDGGYVTASHDISAYMSANTRIRFMSSSSMGNNDRVYFDDIEIQGVTTVTCAVGGPDHFAIEHDGAGVTCQAELVTVRAHDAGHVDEAAYADTVTLSNTAGHGDWSLFAGNGVLTPGAADSGIATYTFDPADNSVVQLLLKNTHVETVNINVIDSSGVTETSGSALPAEDPDLVFAQTGFRFIDAADVPVIGTQIAGKDSATAPNAQNLYLQAVRSSDDGLSCSGVFPNGATVNIELGSSCNDPASCLPGQRVVVTNTGSVTIANPQNQDAGSNYSSVPLTFTTSSRAPLVLAYGDAGQIQLHARYNIPLDDGTPSGNFMIGSSNAFVVRPFGFDLDFSGDRATNGTGGASYAVDANGSIFQLAGAPFDTSLTAVVWSSADDSDNNGVPDACADLTDNTVTANFGNETTAVIPAGVTLSHNLVEPSAGGLPGTLTTSANGATFAVGVGSKTIAWSEVGIMNLAANLADYLGAGQAVQGNVCNVGRFYPNDFVIANAVLTNRSDIPLCADPFTYMDENFTINFDVQAYNAAMPASITQNYIGAFAKLDPAALADMNYAATDSGTDYTARLSVSSAGAFTSGIAPVTASLAMTRNAVPDGLYANLEVGIAPADSDGVNLRTLDLSLDGGPNTHGLLGQTDIRYGRLILQNNFGSELLPLTMPLLAQHYLNGTVGFVTNGDDNCTALTTADVLLYNDQAPKAGRVQGNTVISINGAATTTLTGVSAFAAGVSSLNFSSPGAEGYVDVEVQTPAWLLSDIDGIDQGVQGPGTHCTPGLAVSDPAYIAACAADGNAVDDVPGARGSFGIFKGSDRVIYTREVY